MACRCTRRGSNASGWSDDWMVPRGGRGGSSWLIDSSLLRVATAKVAGNTIPTVNDGVLCSSMAWSE